MIQPILSALTFKPKQVTPPFSWVGHLPFAATLVNEMKPKVLVELGTHTGNSYFSFCQAVQENSQPTRCYAIDTWEGEPHAGLYDESVFEAVSDYNSKNYNGFSKLLRTTFQEAAEEFENQSIDLLHIDGLHTYDAVKNDYNTWLPKVRDGGVILFHDICCRYDDFGVWKLWEELQTIHQFTFSFLHSHGLGVLIKGSAPIQNEFLAELMNEKQTHFWQEIFTTAGNKIVDAAEEENITAQLFLSNRPEFSEAQSISLRYKTGQHISFKFDKLEEYTDGDKPLYLRFDPANRLALITLEEITLVFQGKDGNEIKQQLNPESKLLLTGDLIQSDKARHQHISTGLDPQLIIDPIATEKGILTTLEVRLSIDTDSLAVTSRLKDLITQREHSITTIQTTIGERDNQIAALQTTIDERDNQIAALQTTIDERDNQIAVLQNERTTLMEELDVITNSLSWKMTKPIRILKDKLITKHLSHYSIESPTFDLTKPITGTMSITGWFFGPTNAPAKELRVRVGNSKFKCNPVERDDVVSHFKDKIFNDKNLGFSANVKLGRGLKLIIIEALSKDGNWIKLKQKLVRVERSYSKLDTTGDLEVCRMIIGRLDAKVPNPNHENHPVAVILPIYRDVEMTRSCIEKAMLDIENDSARELIAINDKSPDIEMSNMLQECQAAWPQHFKLIENKTNLGFVQSVNKGLTEASGKDVVLLNSDVYVAKDWLTRLQQEAYSEKDIATVTPLSNNATICSFPRFNYENTNFLDLSVNEIDRFVSKNRLENVVAPTGVGFCMYIRKDCLKKVGILDEKSFGRGYGEENDFCQRAAKLGFKNLITPNLYAHHIGSVSFSDDKAPLVSKALNTLNELHPNYHQDVANFCKTDPLRTARIILAFSIVAELPKIKILTISHSYGGGTQQHIDELTDALKKSAIFVRINPHPQYGKSFVKITVGDETDGNHIIIDAEKNQKELFSILKKFDITFIHYHHFLGLPDNLARLHKTLNLQHKLTIHDFHLLGGNSSLTNEDGIFPGTVEASPLGNGDNTLNSEMNRSNWLDKYRATVETATQVIFPSKDTFNHFKEFFNTKNASIVPHLEPNRSVRKPVVTPPQGTKIRIGVIGAISKEKGADLLEALASLNAEQNGPLEFVLIGYAYRELKGVTSTGKYSNDTLLEKIKKERIQVLFFPARCPETYSYTLSYALCTGLAIFAPNVGAFTERLEGRANAGLFNHLLTTVEIHTKLLLFLDDLKNPKNDKIMLQPEEPSAPSPALHDSKNFYHKAYLNSSPTNLNLL